ncbi:MULTISPECIES: hypothetical protein [Citrobacter]|uniref:hypothetical protein n=1 Tax=Citrobacter TaxID=544 RepID=UPI0010C9C418|nr:MULTISPECIES: hypothetical protein [Citrobacter]MBJ8366378.1 hypothetical protein [Citrobacter cronae]MBJ8395281.1 hypothetical protein [Citrobacter cronae]MBJ8408148.1 hypothetical protein [Citrobacter cronae]MCM8843205.1 hypothetical protein [Citrobacter cronae]TKU31389.1 hypothetical protein FDX09_13060 [Citrobacter sp. wls717]
MIDEMNIKPQSICQRALLLGALFLASVTAQGAQKYGLSDSLQYCELWDTFFPLSFQVPSSNWVSNYSKPELNIIYISAGKRKHVDDYIDLYTINNQSVWPSRLISGRDSAFCQNDGGCVAKGKGSVGKGISAYKDLVAEFPDDDVKIFSGSPYYDGTLSWISLPVRYLKLLRVEFFTPYSGPVGVFTDSYNPYVEPLYFEYRATGNKDEMQLTAVGGTAAGANFNGVNLPDKIRLTSLAALQVWLSSSTGDPWKTLLPYAHTVDMTTSQKALIPDNCK